MIEFVNSLGETLGVALVWGVIGWIILAPLAIGIGKLARYYEVRRWRREIEELRRGAWDNPVKAGPPLSAGPLTDLFDAIVKPNVTYSHIARRRRPAELDDPDRRPVR